MIDYIAAGLDPARFWEITPRLYEIEMRGAAGRVAREKSLAWYAGIMSRLKRPPSLQEFIGPTAASRSDVSACVAAWDKIDAALARNRRRSE